MFYGENFEQYCFVFDLAGFSTYQEVLVFWLSKMKNIGVIHQIEYDFHQSKRIGYRHVKRKLDHQKVGITRKQY